MSKSNLTRTAEPEFRDEALALTDLTLTVFRLNGVLLQWGDKLVEPLGLTSARWQMLGAMALADVPLTAPQIAEVMGVTRQGAQKTLNLLVGLGLAEAQPNPAHRRSPVYRLTEQGRNVYADAERLWTARATDFAARLGAAQTRAAKTTLDAMLRLLVGS